MMDEQQGTASDYEPFTYILEERTFVGFDGCNWYGGGYELKDSIVTFYDFSITEMACNLIVFPAIELQGAYQLDITTEHLLLARNDTILTFISHHTNRVEHSPLIGKMWQLTDSNAPEFGRLDSLNLLPVIEFDDQRIFSTIWYFSGTNSQACNEKYGFYGLGNDQHILFWQKGSKYAAPPGTQNMEDARFIDRILQCRTCTITGAILKLINENDGLFFKFSSSEL
jgi:hypothetical protein